MNTDIEALKDRLIRTVDRHAPFWRAMALRIHAHPELPLEEHKAAAWLVEALEARGFAVERGGQDLPTSFVAARHGGAGGPVVAFFAEYDAMPMVGHACGHNLIGAAACLAGQALAETVDSAEVRVVGSPAEESYGGKKHMLDRGTLAGIDFALMCHGGFVNLPNRHMLAARRFAVEFRRPDGPAGRTAAGPINALDPMVFVMNGVALIRANLRDGARLRAIITDGGDERVAVAAAARAEFRVLALGGAYLAELEAQLMDCARAAARITGTTMTVTDTQTTTLPTKPNAALEAAYAANLRRLGQEVDTWPADEPVGCTDFGNVSHAMPGIHAYFRMVPREVKHHTRAYAGAAGSEAGLAGMVLAAKAMAMTGLDLAQDAALREKVRADFH